MDKQIIIKRLEFISEKLEDLKFDLDKYKKITDLRDRKTSQGAIERWVEEIVESAVNINQEILSSKNKSSTSYYLSFVDLEEFNIFDKDFLKKIASTAGFRNRLSHDYMNVDKKIMIVSATFVLTLYKEYISKINNFLK